MPSTRCKTHTEGVCPECGFSIYWGRCPRCNWPNTIRLPRDSIVGVAKARSMLFGLWCDHVGRVLEDGKLAPSPDDDPCSTLVKRAARLFEDWSEISQKILSESLDSEDPIG